MINDRNRYCFGHLKLDFGICLLFGACYLVLLVEISNHKFQIPNKSKIRNMTYPDGSFYPQREQKTPT